MLDKVLGMFWKNVEKQDMERLSGLTYPDSLTERNDNQYIDDDTWQHQIDVYYPDPKGKKLPVIIDVHGGGWMYGDKELNKDYCLHLAERGYVVFNMSYRLYPEVCVDEQLRDVCFAFKWINEHLDDYPCDKNNIYLTGDSAGGQLASFAAMLSVSPSLREIFDVCDFSLKFNAVGLTSPVNYMEGKAPMGIYTKRMLGKDYLSKPWGKYVNFDKLLSFGTMPPTFLVTSSGDFMAKETTARTASDLKKRGVPVQLMNWEKYDGKDLPHVFSVILPDDEPSCRTIEEMLAFFKQREVIVK